MARCTGPLCQASPLLTPSPRNNASALMQPLSCKETHCRQGPISVDPALSCRTMPEYAHPQLLSHFAMHYDRPISVSSLDHRRGRKKLSMKERRSSHKEGVHDFGYCPLRPSEGFRQTGKLAHSRSFPSSGISATNPAASAVQLANPSRNESPL